MDTIYIIDDNHDCAEVMALIAQSEGFHAKCFFEFSSALKALCNGQRCCLAVVDVKVPGDMTAHDFVSEARKHHPDLKVFVYSGINDVEKVANELNAAGFCRKPCEPDHLIAEFNRACRKAS
ncbi:MAG TPA: response regulator [Planctomycetota bacterium]|nr:response regulator [Planctomycetota bacterium]